MRRRGPAASSVGGGGAGEGSASADVADDTDSDACVLVGRGVGGRPTVHKADAIPGLS
jgi:hypothetical protein